MPWEEGSSQGLQGLDSSPKDESAKESVCPLCGRAKKVPLWRRRSAQFTLLILAEVVGGIALNYYLHSYTQRNEVAQEALRRLYLNPDVVRLLGSPVSIQGNVAGQIREDETGWREAKLLIPVRGPRDEGVARVIGGSEKGRWMFSTFELEVRRQHTRVNLITGKVTEFDPTAYQDVHREGTIVPDFLNTWVPEPRLAPEFPCVWLEASPNAAPSLGSCAMPLPFSAETFDRFEVDLRTGKFILRQTDLSIRDGFEVRLNRTYTTQDWIHSSPDHAFGINSNHPYDIAPVGARNPYPEAVIVLEDADFLDFPRISSGTGYADAVFQHSETSSSFYKAVLRWIGDGWDLKLEDGSEIHFPESYNSVNMAQGAPTWMQDKHGDRAELVRDGQRNLTEIRTPRGHWIRFHHDARSHIVRAEDDHGNWANYSYNPDGMLTDVFHSDGQQRHYTYSGKLMTEVRDQNRRLLLINTYDRGWVVRQVFANGASAQYQYRYGGSRYYAQQVTVTFSDGRTKTVVTGDSVSMYLKRFQ